MIQICRYSCKYFDGGEQLADDIFQNTMLKALKGVHSLRINLSPETTNISKQIKAWLSVIARNELREFLRKNPDEKRLANQFRPKSDELEIPYEIPENKDNISKQTLINKEILDVGLSKLSIRERHILMVYMEYFDPNEPNRHLPDEVIKELCIKYNINSTYLRQIKYRALKKLKNATKNSKH